MSVIISLENPQQYPRMDALIPLLIALGLLVGLDLLALRLGSDSREPMRDDRARRTSRP
jgi:hypothetical protein